MKYKIDIAPLADYYVVIARDKDTDELIETFTLNESGVDMMKLFIEEKDNMTIAKEIAEMYDAPLEIVTKDVNSLEEILRKKGFIQ